MSQQKQKFRSKRKTVDLVKVTSKKVPKANRSQRKPLSTPGETGRLDVDKAVVFSASEALLEYAQRVSAEQSAQALFDGEEVISLVFSLHRIPPKSWTRSKPHRLPIPHGLYDQSEVCVFVKDPQKEWRTFFAENDIKVGKVIGLSKFKVNYKQFEAKRTLNSSYDLFIADDRILPSLARNLGSTFFAKKKQPVPIQFGTKDKIQKNIHNACNSTYLFQTAGSCMVVKVGRTAFTPKQLAANITKVLEQLPKYLPGGAAAVKAVHIKTQDSVALPIFASLPPVSTISEGADQVDSPKTTGKRRKEHNDEDEDEDDLEEEDEEEVARPSKKTIKAAGKSRSNGSTKNKKAANTASTSSLKKKSKRARS